MTKVYLEKNGGRYSVYCHGHATGNEKMCAAISTLVGTLANWLRCTEFSFEERLEDGDAFIRFACGSDIEKAFSANAAFELVSAGFLALQAADRETIEVEIKIF